MRMLGIDPGLRLTGYGCVEGDLSAPVLVEAGVFRLGKAPSATIEEAPGLGGAAAVSSRLAELEHDLCAAIERLKPEAAAVESLFAHYKHPATAIIMGHARGVILLALRRARLPLIELKPNEVKKSITGNGHADKSQMQRAVQVQFNLAEPPSPPDVADAIAIALCAARRWSRREELGETAVIRPARSRRRLASGTFPI
ncbi:MAG: crossover junction endodeoxyribonuclease RuvC [Phycisphaerae bacterium]|nr:Crossover junction endodeoxyribonuclease RuvC [Phycisphaerales bacterium]MCK6478247.1 crossover junction endodeoxyribonuclease RuvC [Phycisphaerales bacterium]